MVVKEFRVVNIGRKLDRQFGSSDPENLSRCMYVRVHRESLFGYPFTRHLVKPQLVQPLHLQPSPNNHTTDLSILFPPSQRPDPGPPNQSHALFTNAGVQQTIPNSKERRRESFPPL